MHLKDPQHDPTQCCALTDDEKQQRAQQLGGLRGARSAAVVLRCAAATTRLLRCYDSFRSPGGPRSARAWWLSLVAVTVLSVATRLAYVTAPYMVIWDEAHFGKMVGYYINGTFFFDVHPTGGKLLLTFFAWAAGYNGTHSFKQPGTSYDGYPEIMFIRVCCALLGASMAPMAFCAAWTMTRRLPAALLAGALVVSEIGTLMLMKFILLDSPLMFFMMASFLGMVRLHHATESHGSFSRHWWACLLFTGFMLGCVASVKFVGLFMVAVVGLYTVQSLWHLFATKGWIELCQHLIARAIGLILLPLVIYVACFVIHDILLQKPTDSFEFHESHFTPGFQMAIPGTVLHNISQPAVVTYGANISLRSVTTGGAFLATFNVSYPAKINRHKVHIVTVGRLKLAANIMQLRYPLDDPDQPDGTYSGPPEVVQHGDMVKIYTTATDEYIFCNNSAAAIAKSHRLVYSAKETEDDPKAEGHLWQVNLDGASDAIESADDDEEQFVDDPSHSWKVLESRVRFYNMQNKCYLTMSGQKLPKTWGMDQVEISCVRLSQSSNAVWYVEQSTDNNVANASFSHMQAGLVSRFVETHKMMSWMNAQFKPAPEERVNAVSPWMWPLCYKSHPWFGDGFRIILLGNPIVFWTNLVGFLAAVMFLLVNAYRSRRYPERRVDPELSSLLFWCRWLLIAYLLHYLPFFTMDRILYYHHYFPALQFSSLLTGVLLGSAISRLPTGASLLTLTLTLLVLACSFCLFSFTGYGVYEPEKYYAENTFRRNLQWFDEWNLI